NWDLIATFHAANDAAGSTEFKGFVSRSKSQHPDCARPIGACGHCTAMTLQGVLSLNDCTSGCVATCLLSRCLAPPTNENGPLQGRFFIARIG
ncbi:hypothetical protein, partial [Xanthomonas axonopodis]|uniref:hypothetical protein n=1 Tax=Xanthomonas axonopodis TaxID=53413 RepID=UPI001ADD5A79